MTNTEWTSIHFDYGGHYANLSEWIPMGSRSLLITKPFEETTYARLVGRICRKIGMDETTTTLKLSYSRFIANAEVLTYVTDDEDVLVYILGCKDKIFGDLHVELMDGVTQNQMCEGRLGEDMTSRVDARNEVMSSDARVNNCRFSLTTESEPQLSLESDPCTEEVELGDTNDICDVVDVIPNAEKNEDVNHEWDDGINMTVGQEFESKKAVQDLVHRAVYMNCFAVVTKRSTRKLYVLKCADARCNWTLRVTKLKNSDYFTVRSYKKMHTCSRMTTSTIKDRRRGTPRMVASVLHDDYPGQVDTPTPKNIIGIVQEKFGVKVSYATAWRGRKQAAKDVHGSLQAAKDVSGSLQAAKDVHGSSVSSTGINGWDYQIIS